MDSSGRAQESVSPEPGTPPAALERIRLFLVHDLWNPQESARRGIAWLRKTLQVVVAAAEGCIEDMILLRASALAYYSMLSLIPLLAIAVTVVRALGMTDNLTGYVVSNLAAGNPDAARFLMDSVAAVDFRGLGTLGAAGLFLTTVLGISSIESTLNAIWGVRRQRPIDRRLTDYLAVLIVAPMLLGVALSLSTTLQSQTLVRELLDVPWFETLYTTGLRQTPLLFLSLGFAFLYWFLPNTSVRLGSALLGGAIAALLFTLTQSVYVGFNVGVSRSNAVFGSFAFLPLLMVWIYLSWVIILLGAEIAFSAQNRASLERARGGAEPGPAAREASGVAIATRVARRFVQHGAAASAERLSEELGLPVRSVRSILDDLEQAGVVATRGEPDEEQFQLARPADTVRVADVLDALRGDRELPEGGGEFSEPVRRVLADLDRGIEATLADRTLADLLEASADVASQPHGPTSR